MRLMRFIALCVCVLALGNGSASAQIETAIPDIGTVKVDIKRVGNTLGVVNQFTPVKSTSRFCSGTCFYASGTKSTNWTCASDKSCQLECSGAPPKGSC